MLRINVDPSRSSGQGTTGEHLEKNFGKGDGKVEDDLDINGGEVHSRSCDVVGY